MTRILILSALVAAVSGCGSAHPYQTEKVTGTVKYDDGSVIPASRIELRFIPQVAAVDAKTKPKLGIAEVDMADGSFSTVNTYEYGDGIITGTHKVTAMAMDERNALLPVIPSRYHDVNTTPLEIDTSQKPLEIVIQKP